MDISIGALLKSFADDKLVAPKVLEKKLDCQTSSHLQQLQIALDALERIGILAKDRGRYRRISEEDVVEGKLRCSSKGFCFAIQDQEDTEDIYIRESQLNTAWNGDRVLVKVTKEGRRRRSPEGEVRLILERANPSVIARVKQTEQGQYRAVPLDDRLLFELELEPDTESPPLEQALEQLVHVEVQRYPLGPVAPVGRVTQILGSDAQSAADTELVYCKYDLPRTFTDKILEVAVAMPTKLDKAAQKKRLNLTDLPTLTISEPERDPTVLDHAFSLETTEEGNWQLGVHVIDVAYYVPSDSLLDREARKRGASICLADQVLPLFPLPFLEQIGTLSVGQERLAISLLVTSTPSGEILEFELQPAVIRVDHALTYQQVQSVLDRHGPDAEAASTAAPLNSIHELIDQLSRLSQARGQHRHQRGSFEIQLSETYPRVYADEGTLGTITLFAPVMARKMVSELLVLANQLVASHLQALEVPAIYRIQSSPDLFDIQDLLKLAENVGLSLALNQEDIIQPQDYQRFIQQFQDIEQAPVLFTLLQSTLKPVTYSEVSGPYFGLALTHGYGHFCAPLNRYGDVLNQRVLHAVFDKGRDRRTTRTKERVNLRHSSCHGQIQWNVLPPEVQRDLESVISEVVPNLNEREQLLLQAERDLIGLQKTKRMQAYTGQVLQGVITGIQSYGFFVRIETLLVEGLVHVSSLKDDWYEYRARQQTLIGRKNRRQYRLGDRVEVEVKSVDYYRQQIDLVVVGGGSEASEEDMMADEPEESLEANLMAGDDDDDFDQEEA
jgi:ribonuclease R